jgi:hypothetical protein
MTQETTAFPPDLSELSRGQLLTALRDIGDELGFAEPLGRSHAGIFVEEGDTLFVSFESVSGIEALSPTRTPLGFEMLRRKGWSSLSLISRGDTWFRDPKVYGFFDQLLDDGFFDEFEQVIFYGAGPCGYAAGAFSVAAPGARVVMLQPQATLDPRVTEWDDRFIEHRRLDFTSRYGFAPDMIDAADEAFVFYDPRERFDAMHSALFERRNVTRHRMPYMGSTLQGDMMSLGLLPQVLEQVADGSFSAESFSKMMRIRRKHMPYLRRLLSDVDKAERPDLAKMICSNVVARMKAPRFRRRLAQITATEEANEDA